MTSESENIKNIAISEFMTRNVKTIRENESVGQACKLMYHDNIGSIVILKEISTLMRADRVAQPRMIHRWE